MTVGKTRRSAKALSAAFVRTINEPGKYHDGGGLGLYLRVESNSARFWVQRIAIGGKRCELGLGSPPLVPLAVARETATENKRMVRAGGDPLRAKRESQAIPTFEEATRKVHEMHKPTWRSEKHGRDFINSMESYAFPRLGARKVSDISTADVLAVLQPIWLDKSETARRVRQRIGTVMKWAVAQGWRQDNPAQDIGQALPKQDRSVAHRKALPYSDVTRCIEAVKASGAWASTKLALEFLVLTVTRSKETRMARWDQIDFHGAASATRATRATWSFLAGDKKEKRSFRIPLPRRAIEILAEAEPLRGKSNLIFPSMRDKPLSDMTLSKLVKELGFNADVHGMRTSFMTWSQEQTNFPREVARAAMAHKVGDAVEQAYARSDVFEKRRKLMESWASYLEARRGEVVKLA